jgi:hypothetical protein
MSTTWRFYNLQTGVLLPGSMLLPTAEAVEANTPLGYVATAELVDPLTQRINPATGLAVPHTPTATLPPLDAPTARAERDRLLAACDWVASRAFETGQPVPAAWAAYRAALRALPQQPGFPAAITWPPVPPA